MVAALALGRTWLLAWCAAGPSRPSCAGKPTNVVYFRKSIKICIEKLVRLEKSISDEI